MRAHCSFLLLTCGLVSISRIAHTGALGSKQDVGTSGEKHSAASSAVLDVRQVKRPTPQDRRPSLKESEPSRDPAAPQELPTPGEPSLQGLVEKGETSRQDWEDLRSTLPRPPLSAEEWMDLLFAGKPAREEPPPRKKSRPAEDPPPTEEPPPRKKSRPAMDPPPTEEPLPRQKLRPVTPMEDVWKGWHEQINPNPSIDPLRPLEPLSDREATACYFIILRWIEKFDELDKTDPDLPDAFRDFVTLSDMIPFSADRITIELRWISRVWTRTPAHNLYDVRINSPPKVPYGGLRMSDWLVRIIASESHKDQWSGWVAGGAVQYDQWEYGFSYAIRRESGPHHDTSSLKRISLFNKDKRPAVPRVYGGPKDPEKERKRRVDEFITGWVVDHILDESLLGSHKIKYYS
ncbi:MAG: hypothetical protein M1837_000451 [Sclerophora amabilis]|nr:MAG: hypothetical protein M1837_000451 [Sclerophora amabilis]